MPSHSALTASVLDMLERCDALDALDSGDPDTIKGAQVLLARAERFSEEVHPTAQRAAIAEAMQLLEERQRAAAFLPGSCKPHYPHSIDG